MLIDTGRRKSPAPSATGHETQIHEPEAISGAFPAGDFLSRVRNPARTFTCLEAWPSSRFFQRTAVAVRCDSPRAAQAHGLTAAAADVLAFDSASQTRTARSFYRCIHPDPERSGSGASPPLTRLHNGKTLACKRA